MKVWIVLEEDRGMGVMVQGVFQDQAQAEECARLSGHFYVEESDMVMADEEDDSLSSVIDSIIYKK